MTLVLGKTLCNNSMLTSGKWPPVLVISRTDGTIFLRICSIRPMPDVSAGTIGSTVGCIDSITRASLLTERLSLATTSVQPVNRLNSNWYKP
ncbi:hypothetical protein D3C76_1667440 [compost metagenome]